HLSVLLSISCSPNRSVTGPMVMAAAARRPDHAPARNPMTTTLDPTTSHLLPDNTRETSFREPLREPMSQELRPDKRIFLLGEEVANYNGAYKVSQGMLDEFGPQRIIDAPISENGFAGLAAGAAMYGLRPIIEFMSWSFSLVAADQILNNVPKMLYMS